MEEFKRPRMAGNQNAVKADTPADSYLHVRITQKKKAAYMRQAQAEEMKLSEWVQDKLDAAAK